VTPALLEEVGSLINRAVDDDVSVRVEVAGKKLGEEGRRGGRVL